MNRRSFFAFMAGAPVAGAASLAVAAPATTEVATISIEVSHDGALKAFLAEHVNREVRAAVRGGFEQFRRSPMVRG